MLYIISFQLYFQFTLLFVYCNSFRFYLFMVIPFIFEIVSHPSRICVINTVKLIRNGGAVSPIRGVFSLCHFCEFGPKPV